MLKWRVGDVTVTRIVEIEAIGGTRFILPQATPEAAQAIGWLYPHFADERGKLKMSVHALVVDTPTRTIIVDTCIGNDKQRTIPAWSNLHTGFLADLTLAGYGRETIDTVLCTHLHVDHVGWNTMLVEGAWIPTFPKARYLMGRTEFDYWRGLDKAAVGADPAVLIDSVQPVWDAGLVDLVETDHQICDEVRLTPTLGHTPGHFIHHPCQMAHPEWASLADYDTEASSRTRRRLFAELAETPTLVIGTHFAAPTAGRIVRDGDAFRLEV